MFKDDTDSDSDSETENEQGAAQETELKGRSRWLKKAVVEKPKKAAAGAPGVPKTKVAAPKIQVVKAQVSNIILTLEDLQRRLAELMATRGRKGTDPRDVLRKLEVLSRASRKFGAKIEIPILMHLISAYNDGARSIDDYMDVQQWRTCYRSLARIMSVLNTNQAFSLGSMPDEDVTDLLAGGVANLMKKTDDAEEETKATDSNVINVVGSLGSFLQRLEDEYTKALQQINPHTSVSDNIYISFAIPTSCEHQEGKHMCHALVL
jgi:translation initiation factor 3 subunit C